MGVLQDIKSVVTYRGTPMRLELKFPPNALFFCCYLSVHPRVTETASVKRLKVKQGWTDNSFGR